MAKEYFEGRRFEPAGKRVVTPLEILAWLFVGGLLLAVVLLGGCAQLPPCPTWGYKIASDDEGAQYLLIDAENAAMLTARLRGLAHGTCRHVPDAPQVPEGAQDT